MSNVRYKLFKNGRLYGVNGRRGLDGDSKFYYVNDFLHREDGPAVEYANGDKEWWVNGVTHRVDGPAVEHVDGSRRWFLNGKCHRVGGPAVEWANGDREWWVDDKLHREDGPAVEEADRKEWWLNGELHRVGGPAIECANGDKWWYQNGQRHRVDGPAVEYANGDKFWYLNGVTHRVDGPAFVYANGNKEWYQNNERHRVGGPAIEDYCRDEFYWYQNGVLHRVDGPAIELSNGDREWFLNGERHRIDGPAKFKVNGTKEWYQEDKLHRLDGPAIEWASGYKEYWIEGKEYKNYQSYIRALRHRNLFVEKDFIKNNSKDIIKDSSFIKREAHLKENISKDLVSKYNKDSSIVQSYRLAYFDSEALSLYDDFDDNEAREEFPEFFNSFDYYVLTLSGIATKDLYKFSLINGVNLPVIGDNNNVSLNDFNRVNTSSEKYFKISKFFIRFMFNLIWLSMIFGLVKLFITSLTCYFILMILGEVREHAYVRDSIIHSKFEYENDGKMFLAGSKPVWNLGDKKTKSFINYQKSLNEHRIPFPNILANDEDFISLYYSVLRKNVVEKAVEVFPNFLSDLRGRLLDIAKLEQDFDKKKDLLSEGDKFIVAKVLGDKVDSLKVLLSSVSSVSGVKSIGVGDMDSPVSMVLKNYNKEPDTIEDKVLVDGDVAFENYPFGKNNIKLEK